MNPASSTSNALADSGKQIREVLAAAREILKGSESARLDAEVLLAFVLDKPRVYLYTWPQRTLSPSQHQHFTALCQQRSRGRPVAHLTGQKAFWNLELSVNDSVLIPRPETELLVELALARINPAAAVVADLGTGSGAIALALGGERPAWRVLACDISFDALTVARQNRSGLKRVNVDILQGNWCQPLANGQMDAIVANPPYIAPDDEHLGRGDVRFEPVTALVAADHGLADIKNIAASAIGKLKPGGLLLLEHGYRQGHAVREILSSLDYQGIETHRDLAGHDRVTLACRGGAKHE